MKITEEVLYLNGEEVKALGGEDMKLAVDDMEQVFRIREQDDVRVPDKVSMNFGKTIAEEKVLGRINAMPGYLGGSYGMAGMKWIGSNPANLKNGLPRASAITILNDPDTKFPIAMMNGAGISNTRTGAVGGVAARVLAKKGSKSLMLFGAGLIGEKLCEAVMVGCPSIEVIYIFDIAKDRAESFAVRLSEKLGVKVIAVDDAKKTSLMCDIVVTATGASSPVIDIDFLSKGALYINFGGFECTYDMVSKSDKRFVDNWEAVKHRNTSAIAKMISDGTADDSILDGEIGQVLEGKCAGRENDDEIIYFNCVGMGIEDVAIATRVYREALKTNTGIILKY